MIEHLNTLDMTSRATRMETLRCHECGEIIGVYEPLVLVSAADDDARTTSRAAEPELGNDLGEYYHRDCYGALAQARSSAA